MNQRSRLFVPAIATRKHANEQMDISHPTRGLR